MGQLQLPGQLVSYNSGSIAALSKGTLYYVYLDDPNLAGGSVTYHATTTKETAIVGTSRYFVGSIFTPTSGAPETFGNNDGGSGAQVGMLNSLTMSIISPGSSEPATAGTGTLTNLEYAIDGDFTTYAAFTITGNGGFNYAGSWFAGPPGLTLAYQSVTLYVTLAIPTNTLSGSDEPSGLSASAVACTTNYIAGGPDAIVVGFSPGAGRGCADYLLLPVGKCLRDQPFAGGGIHIRCKQLLRHRLRGTLLQQRQHGS